MQYQIKTNTHISQHTHLYNENSTFILKNNTKFETLSKDACFMLNRTGIKYCEIVVHKFLSLTFLYLV